MSKNLTRVDHEHPPIKENICSGSDEESVGEMTWSKPVFDEKLKSLSLKHPLFIRKKRVHSASFSHSGANGLTVDGVPSDVRALTAALHRSHVSSTRTLNGKNSKKSRDGRRIPSKRGGKNTENPTEVPDEISIDHEDPNYDSDNEDPVVIESYSPTPSDDAFDRNFTSLVNEFFIHGKPQEVVDALMELNPASHQRRRIPYLAITMALQHKQTQCELTSELLSELCGKVINQAHVQQGFSLVLNELGEITIDFPKASEHVGRFIARALADDILPPKFINYQKSILSPPPMVHCHGDSKNGSSPPTSAPPETTQISSFDASELNFGSTVRSSGARNLSDGSGKDNQLVSTSVSSGIGSASSLTSGPIVHPEVAMSALLRAESLLTLSHAFARLDNIWGLPVGPRTTRVLVKKISGLLKIYFDSKDIDLATETLLELDSPHFLHELVFQAIIMAIERSTDEARDCAIGLLKELCHSVVITPNQLTLGVRRVYAELADLQLDVPAAYILMDRLAKDAHAQGFLTKYLLHEMPIKQRKRFISETDSMYRSGYKPL